VARLEFVAGPLPSGNSGFTLTTLLGTFLDRAEDLYGPRDQRWTLLGIEFAGDVPRTWYPKGGRQQVVVRLSLSARRDAGRAILQLAHETIHLLAPTGVRKRARI
jgi:hypothetical protein